MLNLGNAIIRSADENVNVLTERVPQVIPFNYENLDRTRSDGKVE
jgi:hypothetical protein